MKITKKWLESKGACTDSYNWYLEQNETDADKLFVLALEQGRHDDINWTLARKMNKKQCVAYAVFAAEQVIGIFEKKCPNDTRPRSAIKAAKAYLKNPCKKTIKAAGAAARAAADAAAWAAAKTAAEDTAYAATRAADAAAWAATRAACAAACATRAAAWAAAKKETYVKILKYGFELLKGEQK